MQARHWSIFASESRSGRDRADQDMRPRLVHSAGSGVLALLVAVTLGATGGLTPAASATTASATTAASTGTASAATTTATEGCTPNPVLCPQHIYVGASLDGLPSNLAGVSSFTSATHVSPSVLMYFAGFGDQLSTTNLKAMAAGDRLPMVTWEPYLYTAPKTNPYPLKAIAAGQFDSYLKTQAAAIARVGAPVAIRFAHEMNANWYPWGPGVNGNTPADYVAAFRHVHDVLTAAGATNAVWVWSPNVLAGSATAPTLSPYYPGDAYVDWVALDGYYDTTTTTFTGLFGAALAQLDQLAPNKPIYIAETAVLPSPNRAAMIHDLVTGLLTTPRLVGFTWFDHNTRFNWNIENDPTAAHQLAADLSSPYFAGAGQVASPVLAPPLAQAAPMVTGAPQVGSNLTASAGAWRSAAGSGALTVTTSWYRCTNATTPTSCSAISATGSRYTAVQADFGRFLRVSVTATNGAGSTVVWSAPTQSLLMTPATPAAPTVESRDGALHLTFPAAPTGTTQWQVSINGVVEPLVPVATTDYWLTGLTNGATYAVGLAAVASSPVGRLTSPTVSGTAVPMTAPWNPYVQVSGTTATVKLPPQVPVGATSWLLTVGADTQTLPISTTTTQVISLVPGTTVAWSLRALAGSWNGQSGRTPAATGNLTVPALVTPATPAAPTVESRDGALHLTFPAAPTGTTVWRLTINGVTKPLVPVGTVDYWLTGLTNGTAYSLSLAAVASTRSVTLSSPATFGTGVPMSAPWNPYVTVSGTTATVKLPLQVPVGATSWLLAVGGTTRNLPMSATTAQIGGLVPGVKTTVALRAIGGSWNGQGGSTPAATSTVIAR